MQQRDEPARSGRRPRRPAISGFSASPATSGQRRPDQDGLARLQRSAGNAAVAHLLNGPDPSAAVARAVGGGGQPLPAAVREELEASLGADFTDVRVHTDAEAASSAQSLQARAYTTGSHVVFAPGAYAPATTAGRHTLAHELVHVLQQRQGPVAGTPVGAGLSVSDPADAFEQAAEATAAAVTTRPSPGRGEAPAGPHPPAAQRQALPSEEEEEPLQRAAEDRDEDEDEDEEQS